MGLIIPRCSEHLLGISKGITAYFVLFVPNFLIIFEINKNLLELDLFDCFIKFKYWTK